MMYSRLIVRCLHIRNSCFAAEKSPLATLRKKTGYTFANCKKALDMHNNDLSQAEKWLKQQAQALGWSKATKLEGRQTAQGLVAVAVNGSNATVVEINCETDFVARNTEFHRMAEEAVRSCLSFVENQAPHSEPVTKITLDGEQLKSLPARDGKSLADHLALMIGTVGENASLRRALCLKADEGLHLSGYAHPSGSESNSVLLGRVAGLVALRRSKSTEVDFDKIGKELCQHVVGMSPKKIGTSDDKPSNDKDEETCLIHQEYLLDENITVGELLEDTKIEIVDFERFECGESVPAPANQSLEFIETCQ